MKAFFASLGLLSEAELQQLDGLVTARTLAKGEWLIRAGSVCHELVFLRQGLLRSFYTRDNGDEITYCLTFPGRLMTALSSLITQQPTEENIQALLPCELLVLRRPALEALYAGSCAWTRVGKRLTEQQYVEMEQRIFALQKLSARQRYQQLLAEHPDYLQHVPLQHLASLLGITPRHLSRLRREKTF
ncbi:Crp/Fnr family transcriptional regulator [Hymenobacter sp. B81]|uniref:Crp/Fnr family transcriptional regulator n=1 Tax=Hymenobacter sp. B81 TaxID=3344878 RepID=UPI0037DC9B68